MNTPRVRRSNPNVVDECHDINMIYEIMRRPGTFPSLENEIFLNDVCMKPSIKHESHRDVTTRAKQYHSLDAAYVAAIGGGQPDYEVISRVGLLAWAVTCALNSQGRNLFLHSLIVFLKI